jgi:hypothetical protein
VARWPNLERCLHINSVVHSTASVAVGWIERSPSSCCANHLLLCYARAVTNYRRNFIRGGSFFFTANLAERRLRLLVDDIVPAKDDGFRCRSTHPTRPLSSCAGLDPRIHTDATILIASRPFEKLANMNVYAAALHNHAYQSERPASAGCRRP